jgi:hypothetical protein
MTSLRRASLDGAGVVPGADMMLVGGVLRYGCVMGLWAQRDVFLSAGREVTKRYLCCIQRGANARSNARTHCRVG